MSYSGCMSVFSGSWRDLEGSGAFSSTEIGGITFCSADKGISGVSGAAEAGFPELEGEEGGTTFCDAGVNGAAVAFNSGAAAFGDASCWSSGRRSKVIRTKGSEISWSISFSPEIRTFFVALSGLERVLTCLLEGCSCSSALLLAEEFPEVFSAVEACFCWFFFAGLLLWTFCLLFLALGGIVAKKTEKF